MKPIKPYSKTDFTPLSDDELRQQLADDQDGGKPTRWQGVRAWWRLADLPTKIDVANVALAALALIVLAVCAVLFC